MVLLDSTHEDEYASFPDMNKFVNQAAQGVRLMKFAARLGLGKPIARLSLGSAAKSLSKEDLDLFLTVASRPSHHAAMLAEFTQHRFFYGAQTEVPRSLGDTPLTVITAGDSISGQGKIGGMTAEEVNDQHQRLQKELVRLSSQGEQLIIPGASHLDLLIRPEPAAQVVEAIRCMVEKLRKATPAPA